MKYELFLTVIGIAFLCSSLAPAAITVAGYSLNPRNSNDYPDSGGEMTDGITDSRAWSIPATTISFADVVALTGWLNRDPSITFSFSEAVNVRSFTVWAADSDNSAGVGLPSAVNIRTPDNSFTRTFTVNASDYPGSGFTRPLTFSGFSVTSDELIVTATRAHQWTMLSEVQFSAIPEPKSGLLCGVGLLLFLIRSRGKKVIAG